jgi:predicted transcriptional regulator
MLNVYDQENILKSSQTANLLVQDLQELVKSTNSLLSEIVLELLQQATQIELQLNKIESN